MVHGEFPPLGHSNIDRSFLPGGKRTAAKPE